MRVRVKVKVRDEVKNTIPTSMSFLVGAYRVKGKLMKIR